MPKLLTTPFASEATSEYRTDIQNSTGAKPNSATYEQGFPPVTMEKIVDGGKPPKGSDLNGVLYDITDNLVSLTKGARYGFNEAYATAIGGYPLGAVLRLENGVEVESEIDSNSINPNVDMTGWKLAVSDNGIVTWSGRTQREKNKENPSMLDFKAIGDGVTDDTQAYLDAIEFSRETGILVDGLGKTYFTTTRGSILNALKNATIQANQLTIIFDDVGNSYQTGARDWQSGMSEYNTIRLGGGMRSTDGYNRGAISIGMGSLYNCQNINSAIAIGANTLSKCTSSNSPSYSLAIGDSALTNAVSDGTTYGGSRNLAIGSLAMHYLQSGYMNVAVGRDAGHNLVNASNNTLIGYGSGGGGSSPIGWSGGIELQQGGSNATGVTAVGSTSLWRNVANYNTAVGADALNKIKNDAENTAIGYRAGLDINKFKSYESTVGYYDLSVTGNYTISNSIVTVTLKSDPPTQLNTGDTVYLAVTTGDLTVETGKATVAIASGLRTFTFALPKEGATTGGDLTLRTITTQTPYPTRSVGNVLLGYRACASRIDAVETIAIGTDAFTGNNVGAQTVGAPVSSNNVIIGTRAMREALSANSCTAIGHNAGRWLSTTGTSANGSYENCSLIGNDSRISGDNQVQLGNSTTTTYVYGTVQNRSDKRDKADIRDTELGLAFINSLRPVDYKWDMREDYIETLEDSTIIKHEKDGSKKRSRYHHGFIAQEVPKDFGGYQDHKVNGGSDVLSLGYDEFIAPMVKAIQELSKKVELLEKKLESK